MLNTHTQYQKDTTENTWTHKEVEGSGKFNPHRDYRGQKRQAMAEGHLFDELLLMDGGKLCTSLSKMRKAAKGHEVQGWCGEPHHKYTSNRSIQTFVKNIYVKILKTLTNTMSTWFTHYICQETYNNVINNFIIAYPCIWRIILIKYRLTRPIIQNLLIRKQLR